MGSDWWTAPTFAAGIVILAAGTYGSPMILMRSGIGPANHLADIGIATVVDLNGVGANLADHPGIDFDSGWRGAGNSGPTPALDRDLPEQPGTARMARPT